MTTIIKRIFKDKKGVTLPLMIAWLGFVLPALAIAVDTGYIFFVKTTISNQADLTALGAAEINKDLFNNKGVREIDWGKAQPRTNKIIDEFKKLSPKKYDIVGQPQIIRRSSTGLAVKLVVRVKTIFLHNVLPNAAPGGYVVLNIESKNAVIGQKTVK